MMCEIPDNYMCIDDVVEELKGLKAGIEIKTEGIIDIIDKVIREFVDGPEGQEPLRVPEPISKELENTVQEKLDKATGGQNDQT